MTPGQESRRDIALTSTLYQMDKFVVKNIREGQAAAIHEERSAANVKNVAAIDAFGNPGAAVGELIMRLSGIAVDGSGGKVDAIYIRGMSQDFSSLLMGSVRFRTLHQHGLTDVTDPAHVTTLDRLFAVDDPPISTTRF